MTLDLKYGDRIIYFGNSSLLVGKIDSNSKKASDIKLVTGLMTVGEMEDQAETENYFADDQLHASKKGATLLEGELTLMQLDEAVAEDLMGQVKSENGLGYVSTGNYSERIVQYINKARKKTADGTNIDGYRINVYPALKVTAEATGESETDSSDGTDPMEFTLPVQASGTTAYQAKGQTPAVVSYEVWGEQAKVFEKMMNEELFIMFPDTEIPEKETTGI